MSDWDHDVDFVIVGSGAAGMSAAIRAHDLGAKVLILEGSDQYGGSTAISGGVVWIGNNPQLPDKGIDDSREDVLSYLLHITQGMVEKDRVETYVDESVRMLAYMHEHTHLQLDALESYSDYYPESPGGKPGGRSMEPIPFDASRLGDEFFHLRRPHKQSQVLGKFGITAREAHRFVVADMRGRLALTWRMVQYLFRWFKRRRFHRDTKLHAGNALIARLRLSLMERDVPLMRETLVNGLIHEAGRVVGVEAERNGHMLRIRGKQGVMLAAGGFERNQRMRDKYQRTPISTDWNAGNPHNKGAGIRMGMLAGAAVDNMHEAWWTPVTLVPRSEQAWVLVVEKSLPGGILVNADAARFCNEAAPYQDVVHAMYANNAVPKCYLVFDAEFRKNYPVGPIAPGYAMPDASLGKKYTEGFLLKGDTVEALAQRIQLDPAALQQTLDRFNEQADAGKDTDFGRGDSATDCYYADPRVEPNPTLRALRKGPFYAIRVYPGDLGTKGGLVTDLRGRVLDGENKPLPGLYAAGNTTASVMGPTYPGAGGTIGPALTFGMLAAEAAVEDARA